ncbi:DNA-binding protein [Salmonella enterica]|nr:DNA-binding protein [Salmonella enterica]
MRPATFEAEQIIEAGLALQAEGKRITGFGLRNRTGGGSPARLKQVWDEYQATQTAPSTEPVAELPDEVADAVKGISATLAEQLAKLAAELNDKIIKAAERQVDDITRAAEKQQAETEQELADAAQTVDDLEQKLEAMTTDFRKTQELLDNSREREQTNLVELAQVRERLAATEDRLKASEQAAEEAAEQHRQQQAGLQARLHAAEEKLNEAATHHEAELRDIREQHARNEAAMQKRLDEAGKEAVAEQKKQQTALDQALREAAAARESKAELNGELKSLKEQNRELTALLAGKTEPATAKVKKGARNPA